MHAFVVRPVIVGLLALIAAGLWSGRFTSDGAAPGHRSDCRRASETQTPTILSGMLRRGARC